MTKLPNLKIKRAIVHRILAKDEFTEHATVDPSPNAIDLSAEMQEVIIKRIKTATRNDYRTFALDIENMEEGSFFALGSTIPELSKTDFVDTSVLMSHGLAKTQKHGSIPGGFFVLLDGTYGDNDLPLIAAIKAEPHEALRYAIADDGTVRVELLKSVFLSPSQKLLKIGILFQREDPVGDEVNDIYGCLLYDAQFRVENSPAEYFYKDFLGLTTLQNPRIQSKRFYEKTQEFARSLEEPAFSMDDFEEALRMELASTDKMRLSPAAFGLDHIPDDTQREEYKRQVVDFMPENFIKDTGLVQQQLRTRKIEFENKVAISGPEEEFNRSVQILEQSQDHIVVRINARRKG